MPADDVDRFVAIASFPRSGNTLVRTFLRHLLFQGDPGAIRDMYRSDIFLGRSTMFRGRAVRFYKTHDRIVPEQVEGRPLAHAGYIHILRHPLDVFLSYLNFLTTDPANYPPGSDLAPVDWPFAVPRRHMSEILADGTLEDYFGVFMAFGSLKPEFARRSGSWHEHAAAWLRLGNGLPLIRLRYEELALQPVGALARLVEWLEADKQGLLPAWEKTRADTQPNGGFFWRQQPYGFRELLPQRLIDRFHEVHGGTLEQLGYQSE